MLKRFKVFEIYQRLLLRTSFKNYQKANLLKNTIDGILKIQTTQRVKDKQLIRLSQKYKSQNFNFRATDV